MAGAARPDQKNIQLNPGAPSVRASAEAMRPRIILSSPLKLSPPKRLPQLK